MKNKSQARFLSRWLVALLLFPLAWGYDINRYNGQPVTWNPGTVTMRIELGSATGLSDGSTYNSSAQTAMQTWNSQLGTVQFANQVVAVAAPVDHNGVNEIGFDSTVYGTAFDANVLAITVYYYSTTPRSDSTYQRTQADIIFNNAYTWDSYPGYLRAAEDIHRVLLHELGHVLGLKHPDEANPPQYVTALMNSHVSNLDALAYDDITGAQFLYGAPVSAPSITSQPTNQTVNEGQNAQFSISASGSPTASYLWQRLPAGSGTWANLGDAGAYSGTGTSTLFITSTAAAMNGDQFRCAATNPLGSATSNPAILTIIPATPPNISSNTPFSQSVIAGSDAVFYTSVSGSTPLTYRWQRLPFGGTVWADLTDAGNYSGTSAVYLYVTSATVAMSGDQFRCIVTNIAGSATSNAATLTVTPVIAPKISGLPAMITYGFGDSIDLSATVAGSPPMTYLWTKDGIALTTSGRYIKYGATPSDSGTYTLTATNAAGTDSFSITLTVNPAVAPTITEQPFSISILQGMTGNFSVTAIGTNPTAFQWYKNGMPISGETKSKIVIPNVQLTNLGSYTVAVIDAGGSTISNAAVLSISSIGVVSAAAGNGFSLFIKSDGTLWAMGDNSYGQLGDGTTTTKLNPRQIATGVVAVSAGTSPNSLFLKSDGTLWGMGANSYGQLGDGTTNPHLSPIQIAAGVVTASAGEYDSLFLKSDGTLWGMGANWDGELGDGTTTQHLSPVQIATSVIALSEGGEHSLFVKSDHSLWTMGLNNYGQLGNGTNVYHVISPVQITTEVTAVSAGGIHSLFVKIDGTLWGMGADGRGQLGLPASGVYTGYSSPSQIDTGVTLAAAGGSHSLYLKTDSSLWAVGDDQYGQLGDGVTFTWYSIPKKMAPDVSMIAAGNAHSLFIKYDGSLWAMGPGVLGDGTTYNRPSPVQIISGSIEIPAAPIGSTANHDTLTDRVLLTWSPTIGATNYQVWRSTVNNPASATRLASNVPITLFYDNTVISGTTYYYWIKAVNSAGASSFSGSGTNIISPSNAVITITIQ